MSGFGRDGRFNRSLRVLVVGAGCLALANCANRNMSGRVARIHQRHAVCSGRGCSHHANTARATVPHVTYAYDNGTIVGRRLSGCPHAFCGCEASRYVFGRIRPELNLASNWMRKFPRASPAPGMAAVRNHHVMVLMSHVSGNNWLVHDGNSGHGLTHEHVRSIKGYIIVDPQGTRTTHISLSADRMMPL